MLFSLFMRNLRQRKCMTLAFSYLEVRSGRGIGRPDSTLVAPLIKLQSEQQVKKKSFDVKKESPR